jgi:hypothetical protein
MYKLIEHCHQTLLIPYGYIDYRPTISNKLRTSGHTTKRRTHEITIRLAHVVMRNSADKETETHIQICADVCLLKLFAFHMYVIKHINFISI